MKEKMKKLPKLTKKAQIILAVVLAGIIVLCGIVAVINASSGENSTYRETQVAYGDLTVGISEEGTVDIGTVEQTFELDMSALTRVTTSNSNSSASGSTGGDFGGMGGMGGGNAGGSDAFSQIFNMGGTTTNTSSSSDSKLVVEAINVAVGQEIKEGDVLVVLENEGVEELKSELEENTTKASADLEALKADQELSKITADYTLQTALTYGTYAETEKNETLASLKKDVSDAQTALTTAQETLARYQEQLATAKADYDNAVIGMNNSIWSRDHYNKDTDLYAYCGAFNEAEWAIENAESLANSIEQLESRVKSAQSNVDRYKTNLSKAKRALAQGEITSQQNYEIEMLAYDTAQETYNITISYLEENLEKQEETYADTVSKWNEFNSYIDGVSILSAYSGVVTGISLNVGDGVDTGSTVVTLYNAEEVTMTVSIDEEDMTDIELGGLANISLTAYPDEVFEASVTEISDASTDSSGNTTRDVEVTLKGDMSKLYQGMTGTITFVTKQSEKVLYVSNRAIIRERGTSYVKLKDESGNIKKVKVVTGFSDGVNVEIVEGLTEGQTVIIEKGDSK